MPVPVWSLVITAALPGVFTAVGEVVKCKTGPNRCPGVKRDMIPNESPSANLGFAPFFSRVARRQDPEPVGPCGIAQFEFDRCQADASAIVVQTSIPAPGGMLGWKTPIFPCMRTGRQKLTIENSCSI